MTMTRNEAIGIQKAALWEQAKGLLRATVSVGGQCSSIDEEMIARYRALDKAVESFIKKVEGEGWQE